MTNKPLLSLFWLAVHVVFAIGASNSSMFSQIWAASVLLLGIHKIIKNQDHCNEALQWSAYMAGLEVVLRGTGGSLVWELGKYSVILFLFLGLSQNHSKCRESVSWIFLCALLLLPGVLITLTWSDRFSEDISFNVSGISCLLMSSFYFSKCAISKESLNKIFSFFLLPTISLAVVLFYKAPDISAIDFGSKANFEASGGFGPNQVATILGAGWVLILVLINKKSNVTKSKLITYAILAFLVFRSLLTFSRGGNIAAILAYMAFIYTYVRANDTRFISKSFFRNIIVTSILAVFLVNVVNDITGGMFANRYLGLNVEGEKKEDVTAGRLDLLEEEYALFAENPLGVGIGGSMHFRTIQFNNPLASHNEFGRLLSEHGILGIIIIILILYKPIKYYRNNRDIDAKSLCVLFFIISMMTATHSAFRLAMPAFFYGLSFLKFSNNESSLHR